MRLWHYELIPYLPKSQLVAQWRELNSIFKKQDKHILINYVYEYDRVHLLAYSLLVISELQERDISVKTLENFNEFFKYTKLLAASSLPTFKPFPNHHTRRYLLQCFANLQEKYDRGQQDFSDDVYEKLRKFVFRKEVDK